MIHIILLLFTLLSWAELPIDRPMYEFEKNLKQEILQSLENYYEGRVKVSVFLTIKSATLAEKTQTQSVDLGYMPTPVVVKAQPGAKGLIVQRIDIHAFIHHKGEDSEKQDLINIIKSAISPYQGQILISFKVKAAPKKETEKSSEPAKSWQDKVKENLIKESGRLADILIAVIFILVFALFMLLVPIQIKSLMKTFFEGTAKSITTLKQADPVSNKEIKETVIDQSALNAFRTALLSFPKSFRHYFHHASQEDKTLLAMAISMLSPEDLQVAKPYLHDLIGKIPSSFKITINPEKLNPWLESIARTIALTDTVDRRLLEDFISPEQFKKISKLSLEQMIEIGQKKKMASVWTAIMLSRSPEESSVILSDLDDVTRLRVLDNSHLDLITLNQAIDLILEEGENGDSSQFSKISKELVNSFTLMLESKTDDEAKLLLTGLKTTSRELYQVVERAYWPVSKISELAPEFIKSILNESDIEEKTLIYMGLDNSGRKLILNIVDKKLQTMLEDGLQKQARNPNLEVKRNSQAAVRKFIKKCQKAKQEESIAA